MSRRRAPCPGGKFIMGGIYRMALTGERIISKDGNNLTLTNYRLIWKNEEQVYYVPVGLIEDVIEEEKTLTVLCKTGPTYRIPMSKLMSFTFFKWKNTILRAAQDVAGFNRTFSRQYYLKSMQMADVDPEWKPVHDMLDRKFDESPIVREFERQEFPTSKWRISDVNKSFSLCSTYPEHLIVPTNVSDDTLTNAASFRIKQRLPAVTWSR